MTNSGTATTHAQLQTFLEKLSIQEAMRVAQECIQHTMNEGVRPASIANVAASSRNETSTGPNLSMSNPPVLAFSLRATNERRQDIQWYHPKDLEKYLEATASD